MTQRKVVLHRILRIEGAKRRGDVLSHLPPGADALRQSQTPADPDDVGVERHDEARRGYLGPYAEIQRVPTHHPA
jgi:hypothetical protein